MRGISPFQRQPSTVYRAQDTSPLIVFDDADQQQAMVHREHSPGAKEVRSDWVWGRIPSCSRYRSRSRAPLRRRRRHRRDPSESEDSDDNRPSSRRQHVAVTTTPRRGCGQDYERKSILSERSAYGSDDSFRPLRSPATPTTGRPPVAFTDYDEGARTPTGPRSATATDRFRERDRGVPDVPNYFSSDGRATPVTSPRPALVAGQRTAPMACPTVVQTSIGSPATPVNEYQAAPAGGPAQRHQSGAALNPAATNRGSDDTSREPPSAGQPPPGDNVTPTDVADSSTETTTTVDAHARRHIANVGVKLGTYDGSSCLETFLASLRNFATYFKWNEEDELFHFRASLKGPAGQLLWDLGSDVTLAELIRLLRNRFGTSNQVERFRAELQTRKRRPGEQLQKLYNDICRLMSLAYPGPSSEIVNVVGREAFLEALGDPYQTYT